MSPMRGILFRFNFLKHRFASLHNTRTRALSSAEGSIVNVENLFPRLCGPSVKKLLQEYGIQFANVPKSGPHGNILKGDVLTYIQDKKLVLSPTTTKKPFESREKIIVRGKAHDDVEISSSKKTTAQQSVLSKTSIPHSYMSVECNVNKVFEYQKRMKEDGFDVLLIDFLIRSAASALGKVPDMNILKVGGQVKPLQVINISVEEDLQSILIKKADELTVQLISEQRQRCTENNDFSFRLVNLGMFGVSEFTAVISPPEVAILAVGAVNCVYKEQKLEQKMKITLSFNNEVISEEVAASFIHYLKEHLENPLSACLT